MSFVLRLAKKLPVAPMRMAEGTETKPVTFGLEIASAIMTDAPAHGVTATQPVMMPEHSAITLSLRSKPTELSVVSHKKA